MHNVFIDCGCGCVCDVLLRAKAYEGVLLHLTCPSHPPLTLYLSWKEQVFIM